MKAKESGEPYDRAAYDATVSKAVADVVRNQAESGIDVVNDGEQSKTGFSNYLRDRLGGFEPVKDASRVGPPRSGGREEQLFPEYYEQYYKIGYFTTRVAIQYPMVCTGPITYKPEQIQTDLTNLKAALAGLDIEEAFVPATTPNLNQRNEYYKTPEEFTYAVADAISQEYKAIGKFLPLANRNNDYLIDRELQVKGEDGKWTYTGVPAPAQDLMAQESMGGVYDRTQEHLATTDGMIIRTRRKLINAAKALREGGAIPPGVDAPELYRMRSGGALLPKGTDGLMVLDDVFHARADTVEVAVEVQAGCA